MEPWNWENTHGSLPCRIRKHIPTLLSCWSFIFRNAKIAAVHISKVSPWLSAISWWFCWYTIQVFLLFGAVFLTEIVGFAGKNPPQLPREKRSRSWASFKSAIQSSPRQSQEQSHATQRVGMLLGPQVKEWWFNASYLSGPFETEWDELCICIFNSLVS